MVAFSRASSRALVFTVFAVNEAHSVAHERAHFAKLSARGSAGFVARRSREASGAQQHAQRCPAQHVSVAGQPTKLGPQAPLTPGLIQQQQPPQSMKAALHELGWHFAAHTSPEPPLPPLLAPPLLAPPLLAPPLLAPPEPA
jgi:hypothetical protein